MDEQKPIGDPLPQNISEKLGQSPPTVVKAGDPKLQVLAVMVLIFFAVAGYVFFHYYKIQNGYLVKPQATESQPIKQVTLEQCQAETNPEKSGNCFMELGRQKMDESLCKGIPIAYQQNPCIMGVAIGKKDISVCRSSFSGTQSYLVDSCISAVATETNQDKLCSEVSETAGQQCLLKVASQNSRDDLCLKLTENSVIDSCFSAVAVNSKNPLICEKIKDQQAWEGCYYQLAQKLEEPGLCDKLFDAGMLYSKGSCLSNLADQKKDSSICEKITDQFYKDDCVAKSVIWEKNPLLCDKVQDQNSKVGCYQIAAEQLNDVRICENFNDNNGWGMRDGCVKDFAIAKNRPELCETINHVELEDECVRRDPGPGSRTIGGQPSVSDCSSAQYPLDKFNCIYQKVLSQKDYKVCEQMPKDGWRDECYKQFVSDTKNFQACLYIKEQREKDFCIQRWGSETGDSSKCNLISDPGIKNGCSYGSGSPPPTQSACSNSQGTLKTVVTYDAQPARNVKAGDVVIYKFSVKNNDTCVAGFGGASMAMSTLGLNDLAQDTSNYAKDAPYGVAPGATYTGELFRLTVSPTAQPQTVSGSNRFYMINGTKESDIYDFKFTLHITK